MDLPAHNDCYGCGKPGDGRIDINYRWDESTSRIGGTVTFGPMAQGPPGHVHGGGLATVLDEAMGAAAWLSGHTCVAVSITINYREMVPLGSELRIQAWVDKVEGRKVYAAGSLANLQGAVTSEASGLFIVISAEKLGNRVPGTQHTIDQYHLWRNSL